MKNYRKLFLLLVCALGVAFIFLSCRKDDDGDDGGDGGSTAGTMQAKVSGAGDFKASGQLATATYVSAGKMLTIYGTDLSGRAVQLIINGYTGVTGSYTIADANTIANTAAYVETNGSSSQTWAAPYSGSGNVGEVKISEFSSTGSVKGTFTFKAKNQSGADFKDITEGTFNLTVKSY